MYFRFVHRLYDLFLNKQWEEFDAMLAPNLICEMDGVIISRENFMSRMRNGTWNGKNIEVFDITVQPINEGTSTEVRCRVKFDGEFDGVVMNFGAEERMIIGVQENRLRLQEWYITNSVRPNS